MDEHLSAALKWLKSKTRTAYSQIEVVYSGLDVLPLRHALGDNVIQNEKHILLHKGRIGDLELADMANLAGRSDVVYANDVYVVLRSRSIVRESDAVKSLYYNLRDVNGSINVGAAGPTKAGRFCHYIGNDTILTETYFRRKIFLDSTDISLTPHIMYNGEWEPWVTKFISASLRPNDVMIDVGANCGFYTLLAADIVGPGGRVIAIEPQAELWARIDKSISVNGFGGFVASIQVAAGEEDTTARLNHPGDSRGSSSIVNFTGSNKGETINIRPLPDIVREVQELRSWKIVPDLIKIDVEGFEVSVWRGMRSWLSELSSVTIITEFSPATYKSIGEDPRDYFEDILNSGFKVSRLNHDATETHFGINDVADVMSANSYADLILRKGAI